MPVSKDQELRQPCDDSPPKPQNILAPPKGFSISRNFTTRHRPAYARVPSVGVVDLQADMAPQKEEDTVRVLDFASPAATSGHGLGIEVDSASRSQHDQLDNHTGRSSPADGRTTPNAQSSEASKPLVSPLSAGSFPSRLPFGFASTDFDTSYANMKHYAKPSQSSLHSTYPRSEASILRRSIQDQFDDFAPRHVCNSVKTFRRGMSNWLAGTIIACSVFSSVFSGAYLIIALHGPRYGRLVGSDVALSVSTAAFLTSFFAKLIELTFATVVVAFLGQALARRAHQRIAHPGVTLAEMNMRNWVMQPGSMVTHWESVRYAGASLLGLLALVAAVMALLYTSAATALVQPQLKFSNWENRVMQGTVKTSFANGPYIQANCKTPITTALDDELDIGDACVEIEHAAQAYNNYQQWLADWADYAQSGNGSRDLSSRPKGYALFNDNTTVIAPWIEQNNTNMTALYQKYNFVVNNVTMAMPHAGVVAAASDSNNNIMQPEQLNGIGIYSIRASVPSPYINVICAMGMTADLLEPFVYELWPGPKAEFKASTWPAQLDNYSYPSPYLNSTPLDDVFQWGPKWGEDNWPPIFPKLPSDYNTLINDTTGIPYGRNAIYILGKGGDVDANAVPTDANYALCELRVGQTPACSTQYNASSHVGTLEAICEDSNDDLRYIKSMGNATSGSFFVNKDWPNIASVWSHSLSLGDGEIDGNSSNARIWTELILTASSAEGAQLSNSLPSPAEALAVMAGCTLLQATTDAPFVEFWNYSANPIEPGQTQWFNASVRAQQYASGGGQNYEKAFFIVLFAVFIINLIILAYFVLHREWYTDFSDPTNLFTLAINSPPSEKLAESSCGTDNSGSKFKYYWKLGNESGHVFMESPDAECLGDSPRTRRRQLSGTLEMLTSPVAKFAGKWQKSPPQGHQ